MTEQLSPDALQFSETVRRYGGKEAYGRDLAAGRTALPYERWVQIRTPVFLAESAYGDWQSVSNRLYLDSEPITTVTGEEIPKGNSKEHFTRLTAWFKEQYNGKIIVNGVGEILLDRRAIKNDIGHGWGSVKILTFPIIPNILQDGRIIYAEDLRNERLKGSYLYFSAPIQIRNKEFNKELDKDSNKTSNEHTSHDFVVIVTVKALEELDPKTMQSLRRLYVHEVGLRELFQNKEPQHHSEFKTGLAAPHGEEFHGPSDAGAIRKILLRAYAVKPESLKAALIPETGEPRLDLLEKEYPSPLIDLRGLGCREAARKLHDLTRGSITHLPLIEASIAADGSKQLDVRRLLVAQRLHPTPRKDEWLKAVMEAPQRDKQHHRQQDWDMTR
ncbi:hypothetical protein [uncultured Cardiobacterium sp.]|uniref:hypothetical protein n=1 Tax=uncultured Cardiobacterium sp. TaxID=417619 RepID=UPI00262429E3|nr:hypothetical protein [uncultured Cardiobacterium sp.]